MAYLAVLVELHSATIHQGTAICLGVVLCSLALVLVPTMWWAWFRLRTDYMEYMETKETVIIEIESSPEPTRMPSTPFWESTPRARKRSVRRGGGRRYKQHVRSCTRSFNPRLPHHCAYQCVLRAALLPEGARQVHQLREATADMLFKMYVNYEMVHGMNVRDVVAASGQTLAAYVADVRNTQWASSLEVAIASDIVGARLAIDVGGSMTLLSRRPSYMIKLMKKHWTLHRVHRLSKVRHQHDRTRDAQRGGMWTWEETEEQPQQGHQQTDPNMQQEDEVIPEWATLSTLPPPVGAMATSMVSMISPTAPNADYRISPVPERAPLPIQCVMSASKCVHVRFDLSLPTDVIALDIQVQCAAPLGVTVDRIARVINVPSGTLAATSSAQSLQALPLCDPCPDSLYIMDSANTSEGAQCEINVYLGSTGVHFILKCQSHWQQRDIIGVLATIMSCAPPSLLMLDRQGAPWMYVRGGPNLDLFVSNVGMQRGGMHNSVSTTLPFEPDEEPAAQPLQPQQPEVPPHQGRQDEESTAQPLPLIPEDPVQPDIAINDDESDHYDPAHERDSFLAWLQDIGAEVEFSRSPARRSRTPRRDRHASPMVRGSRSRSRSPGLAMTVFRSTIWPTSPPAAQPDPVSR